MISMEKVHADKIAVENISVENVSRRGFLQGMLGASAFVLSVHVFPTSLLAETASGMSVVMTMSPAAQRSAIQSSAAPNPGQTTSSISSVLGTRMGVLATTATCVW